MGDMTKFLVGMLGSLLISLSGCAINDKGFVSIRYFENKSTYRISYESWGGYLSTRSADGGLTLGHAERILIYPKHANQPEISVDELLQEAMAADLEHEIEFGNLDIEDAQPYAWIEKNQGIVFHVNSMKTGISAGVETRSVMRLPVDFDGIFVFRYRTDGTVEAYSRNDRTVNNFH